MILFSKGGALFPSVKKIKFKQKINDLFAILESHFTITISFRFLTCHHDDFSFTHTFSLCNIIRISFQFSIRLRKYYTLCYGSSHATPSLHIYSIYTHLVLFIFITAKYRFGRCFLFFFSSLF